MKRSSKPQFRAAHSICEAPACAVSRARSARRRRRWHRVEEHIERRDFVAAHDDHVEAGIVGRLSGRAGAPRQTAGVVERLRLAVWRIDETRVSRAQVSRELVQGVAPDKNAGRRVEDAVIGVELVDSRATTGGVAFSENLLEVAV